MNSALFILSLVACATSVPLKPEHNKLSQPLAGKFVGIHEFTHPLMMDSLREMDRNKLTQSLAHGAGEIVGKGIHQLPKLLLRESEDRNTLTQDISKGVHAVSSFVHKHPEIGQFGSGVWDGIKGREMDRNTLTQGISKGAHAVTSFVHNHPEIGQFTHGVAQGLGLGREMQDDRSKTTQWLAHEAGTVVGHGIKEIPKFLRESEADRNWFTNDVSKVVHNPEVQQFGKGVWEGVKGREMQEDRNTLTQGISKGAHAVTSFVHNHPEIGQFTHGVAQGLGLGREMQDDRNWFTNDVSKVIHNPEVQQFGKGVWEGVKGREMQEDRSKTTQWLAHEAGTVVGHGIKEIPKFLRESEADRNWFTNDVSKVIHNPEVQQFGKGVWEGVKGREMQEDRSKTTQWLAHEAGTVVGHGIKEIPKFLRESEDRNHLTQTIAKDAGKLIGTGLHFAPMLLL